MAYRECRGIAPLILNLSARWKLVVSFPPQSLYIQGSTPVPTEQDAGCAPRAALNGLKKGKFLTSTGIQTPDQPAHSLVNLPTAQST
jgi:hypothetical protein